MKSAPRAGPSASEHRFLTFTEGAAFIPRSRPFPPGGGLGTAFRSKMHAKIVRKFGLLFMLIRAALGLLLGLIWVTFGDFSIQKRTRDAKTRFHEFAALCK